MDPVLKRKFVKSPTVQALPFSTLDRLEPMRPIHAKALGGIIADHPLGLSPAQSRMLKPKNPAPWEQGIAELKKLDAMGRVKLPPKFVA